MIANAGIVIAKPVVESARPKASAIQPRHTDTWPASVEDWHRIHNINGLGLFLCYKHAAIKMQQLGNKSGASLAHPQSLANWANLSPPHTARPSLAFAVLRRHSPANWRIRALLSTATAQAQSTRSCSAS
ncbi:hypothetical protein BD626DRAFT_149989 [Schizophyllum amplum]|uniref:Uncharacterized protein n=1 Tax=Schizophyllum amplum TaxID=97359 RepID=A0A550C3Y7_9AGAR|nr:hypothetical protein BD626DRAFT_149989 [Auriculariopsis ampla]